MNTYSNLPDEVILPQLLQLSVSDLVAACQLDKRVSQICKRHETEIYTNLLQREFGEWTFDPKLLFTVLHSVKKLSLPYHSSILQSTLDANNDKMLKILLINFGLDVETKINNTTLLEYALSSDIFEAPYECIQVLINANANVNRSSHTDWSPIMEILRNDSGNLPVHIILRALSGYIDTNAYSHRGENIFHVAFMNGDLDMAIIKRLLQFEFDINLPDKRGYTPLTNIIQCHSRDFDDEIIQLVLSKQPDFNTNTYIEVHGPLVINMMYVYRNHLDNLYLRAVDSVDINIVDSVNVPMIIHAFLNDIPTNLLVHMLNKSGINVDVHDRHAKTLAMLCVIKADANILVDVLLTKSPNLDLVDDKNNTAAMLAISSGHLSHDKILRVLQRTTNVTQNNIEGETVLYLALQHIKNTLVNMIVKYILDKVPNYQVTFSEMQAAARNRFVTPEVRKTLQQLF